MTSIISKALIRIGSYEIKHQVIVATHGLFNVLSPRTVGHFYCKCADIELFRLTNTTAYAIKLYLYDRDTPKTKSEDEKGKFDHLHVTDDYIKDLISGFFFQLQEIALDRTKLVTDALADYLVNVSTLRSIHIVECPLITHKFYTKMLKHPSDAVKMEIAHNIGVIAQDSPRFRVAAAEGGMCEALCDIIDPGVRDLSLLVEAVFALAKISRDNPSLEDRDIVSYLPKIILCLNCSDKKVQAEALRFLGRATERGAEFNKLVNEQYPEVWERVAELFGRRTSLLSSLWCACRIIVNVSISVPQIGGRFFYEYGFVEHLMRRTADLSDPHIHDDSIVETAVLALLRFIREGCVRKDDFRRSDAFKWMVQMSMMKKRTYGTIMSHTLDTGTNMVTFASVALYDQDRDKYMSSFPNKDPSSLEGWTVERLLCPITTKTETNPYELTEMERAVTRGLRNCAETIIAKDDPEKYRELFMFGKPHSEEAEQLLLSTCRRVLSAHEQYLAGDNCKMSASGKCPSLVFGVFVDECPISNEVIGALYQNSTKQLRLNFDDLIAIASGESGVQFLVRMNYIEFLLHNLQFWGARSMTADILRRAQSIVGHFIRIYEQDVQSFPRMMARYQQNKIADVESKKETFDNHDDLQDEHSVRSIVSRHKQSLVTEGAGSINNFDFPIFEQKNSFHGFYELGLEDVFDSAIDFNNRNSSRITTTPCCKQSQVYLFRLVAEYCSIEIGSRKIDEHRGLVVSTATSQEAPNNNFVNTLLTKDGEPSNNNNDSNNNAFSFDDVRHPLYNNDTQLKFLMDENDLLDQEKKMLRTKTVTSLPSDCSNSAISDWRKEVVEPQNSNIYHRRMILDAKKTSYFSQRKSDLLFEQDIVEDLANSENDQNLLEDAAASATASMSLSSFLNNTEEEDDDDTSDEDVELGKPLDDKSRKLKINDFVKTSRWAIRAVELGRVFSERSVARAASNSKVYLIMMCELRKKLKRLAGIKDDEEDGSTLGKPKLAAVRRQREEEDDDNDNDDKIGNDETQQPASIVVPPKTSSAKTTSSSLPVSIRIPLNDYAARLDKFDENNNNCIKVVKTSSVSTPVTPVAIRTGRLGVVGIVLKLFPPEKQNELAELLNIMVAFTDSEAESLDRRHRVLDASSSHPRRCLSMLHVQIADVYHRVRNDSRSRKQQDDDHNLGLDNNDSNDNDQLDTSVKSN